MQTLSDFYRDLFSPLVLRSRADNTRRLYLNTLGHFRRFLDRAPTLADLNDLTVSKFLAWFKALPRAAATVNKERANLLSLWHYAARKGFVTVWPDVPPEPEPERIPQAWTEEEMSRLLRACAAEPGNYRGVSAAQWWRTLLFCLWDTGERIGGLRDLTWGHVDLSGRWLLVPYKVRKRQTRDRLYRLGADTVEELRGIMLPAREEIFCWPFCRGYLWDKYRRILKRAGLPHDRKSMFHRWRRSVASHAEAAGADASAMLDHADRKTTKAYLDPRVVKSIHAADVLFRLT